MATFIERLSKGPGSHVNGYHFEKIVVSGKFEPGNL
jgi:hypothetical protein